MYMYYVSEHMCAWRWSLFTVVWQTHIVNQNAVHKDHHMKCLQS